MTKRIKRIAAWIMAGILLVCISFTALAEETNEIVEENTEVTEATETQEPAAEPASEPTAEEPAEVISEPVTEEVAAPEVVETVSEPVAETVEEPAAAEPAQQETVTEAPKAEETAEQTEVYNQPEGMENQEEEEEEYDESELVELGDDAGYVDPELISQYIPEVTEELKASSDIFADDTEETNEDGNAEQVKRAWIETEDNEKLYFGETVVLLAKAEPELNGNVRWEIRDDRWEEEIWEPFGEGERLELDVTEAIAGLQIRFVLEDGMISEDFLLNATEKPEGVDEAAENTETAEEASEELNTEANETDETAADLNAETEDADAETADEEASDEEEPENEITRAWITASIEGEAQIGDVVMLTANAEPEMTGVNIWETRSNETEEDAWQRIGYGDAVTVEVTEENIYNAYRFVMQDGPVSEEYRLAVETEVEAVAETEEEAETLSIPEEAKVSFEITWDAAPALGETAHFTAVIEGLEGYTYTLQWQRSAEGEEWLNLDGETEIQMDQVITEENAAWFWRVNVTVTGRIPAEETEEMTTEEN